MWRTSLAHEARLHMQDEMLQDIQPPCILHFYVLGLMNFFKQNINKLLIAWPSMLWHHVAWQVSSIISEEKYCCYHQSKSENGSSKYFWNGGSHLPDYTMSQHRKPCYASIIVNIPNIMYARHIYSFVLFISATDLFPILIQLNLKNYIKSRGVHLGFFGTWDSNHSSWP